MPRFAQLFEALPVTSRGIATWWSTERTCTRAQESGNSTVAVHELVVEPAVRSRSVERLSIATDRSGVQPRA